MCFEKWSEKKLGRVGITFEKKIKVPKSVQNYGYLVDKGKQFIRNARKNIYTVKHS